MEKKNNGRFKVGDMVNSVCGDWEYDNPMEVVEEMHICHCPCKGEGMISARGKSGDIYEEFCDTWERVQ